MGQLPVTRNAKSATFPLSLYANTRHVTYECIECDYWLDKAAIQHEMWLCHETTIISCFWRNIGWTGYFVAWHGTLNKMHTRRRRKNPTLHEWKLQALCTFRHWNGTYIISQITLSKQKSFFARPCHSVRMRRHGGVTAWENCVRQKQPTIVPVFGQFNSLLHHTNAAQFAHHATRYLWCLMALILYTMCFVRIPNPLRFTLPVRMVVDCRVVSSHSSTDRTHSTLCLFLCFEW